MTEFNPLLQAFGRAIQLLRKKNGKKAIERAKEIKVAPSLMRMIESGDAFMHPKYFPAFIKINPDIVLERLATLHCICKHLEHSEEQEYEEIYRFFSVLDLELIPVFDSLVGEKNVDEKKLNQRAHVVMRYLTRYEEQDIRQLKKMIEINPEVLNLLKVLVEKISVLKEETFKN